MTTSRSAVGNAIISVLTLATWGIGQSTQSADAGTIVCAAVSPAFNAECQATLDSIQTTEIGNALLGEIEQSDRTVLIAKEDRPLYDGLYDEPRQRQIIVFWQAAAIVDFPDEYDVQAVPKATLFHELVHALLYGSDTKDLVPFLNLSAGNIAWRDFGNEVIATYTENVFRKQAGLDQEYGLRTHYGPRLLPALPTPIQTPGPRFTDNGDGTVTDTQTGLQWERKTGSVNSRIDCAVAACPDPHEVNNAYQWCLDTSVGGGTLCDNPDYPPDGGAFTGFLLTLNTQGFADHSDWRLPTSDELKELWVQPCPPYPAMCIDPMLGPAVAPDQQGGFYWSATDDMYGGADIVGTTMGSGGSWYKDRSFYVRAVRP